MNWFRNNTGKSYTLLVFGFLLLLFKTARGQNIGEVRPYFEHGANIYADIDTANQHVFVLSGRYLWKYDLQKNNWSTPDTLSTLKEKLLDLEFGYNPSDKKLQLWSRGIGRMYSLHYKENTLRRVDKSHHHRNQFGHLPFYYEGILHVFGGYGYWEWKNIITFYNQDIHEWNIQKVDPHSILPEKRTPATGIFSAKKKELLIYGGESTVRQHPDDMKASRFQSNDIWKFSFNDLTWSKLMELEDEKVAFFNPASVKRVGRTNKISSSFFIPKMKLWFVPVVQLSKPDDAYYLKPINIEKEVSYPRIPLEFGKSNEFMPTNFLYDTKSESAVIVGFDYLANAKKYPIRIERIASDSLRKQIPEPTMLSSVPFYVIIIGIMSLLLMGGIYYRVQQGKEDESKNTALPLTSDFIDGFDELKTKEKELIKYFLSAEDYLEPQEIEELLWSDVNSYDYRRRLRNDLIKSINEKFQQVFSENEKVILRKKDPNDNRRYLYGINRIFIRKNDS